MDKKFRQFEETVTRLKAEHRTLVRVFLWVKAVVIGGAVPHRFQKDFAEELDLTPRTLTIWNAAIGLAIAFFEYVVFGKGGGYITDKMADWFDLTYTTAVYIYVGYNAGQNIIRIIYAWLTRKGIAAFTPSAAAIDSVYIPYYYLVRKKKRKPEQNKQ